MTDAPENTIRPDAAGLDAAAAMLRAGQLVAFPTETVYGLGADARNDHAVARIFAAKGRPSFNPLIAHVPDMAFAKTLCVFDAAASKLASTYWPGALTLVLPMRDDAGISRLVTAGLGTLAIRVPDHEVAHGLLARFAGPIAAPSANPSGRISPTTAAHVRGGLGPKVDAVIDGGPCGVGVESTIVSCVGTPTLLRAGGIPTEALEACLGQPLAAPAAQDAPIAPGQLASHYAPRGSVRLNVTTPESDETLLGFGPVEAALNLSPTGDLTEAAAHLFAYLHQLDRKGVRRIAVSPIPEHGLGRAINDRLRRAAAPR
ncbi:L-threonylcarbamoyladenylate synthase [Yoonia sp. SS1-5]|uniref:Threonylcarbamoyl-AMP synthase n=1 Tax=Yoonia rhodophyticola TaxID=3137370 RepID=A0AAN0NM40_9RHOB